MGFSGEWLLDIVWLDIPNFASIEERENQGWLRTKGICMACECEWGSSQGEILADFLKLTFVIADIRLFVYTRDAAKRNYDAVKWCEEACPPSRNSRYLLVGIPGTGEFRVDAWEK